MPSKHSIVKVKNKGASGTIRTVNKYGGRFISRGRLRSYANLRGRGHRTPATTDDSTTKSEGPPHPKPPLIPDGICEGRRIVDLKHLAEGMVCQKCNSLLHLSGITEETLCMLTSRLSVVCHHCKAKNTVFTNKNSVLSASGRKISDVNLKGAMGVLDAGIGCTKFNALLSSLNIPTCNPSSLKAAERIVGKAVIQECDDSCLRACVEERELTMSSYESSIVQTERTTADMQSESPAGEVDVLESGSAERCMEATREDVDALNDTHFNISAPSDTANQIKGQLIDYPYRMPPMDPVKVGKIEESGVS